MSILLFGSLALFASVRPATNSDGIRSSTAAAPAFCHDGSAPAPPDASPCPAVPAPSAAQPVAPRYRTAPRVLLILSSSADSVTPTGTLVEPETLPSTCPSAIGEGGN